MNLRVEKLSFGYGRMIVGNDVSFTLDAGEVLCLLGPNGAGKTTLFKTILGLVPPLGGTVMADGAAIHQWSRQSLARVFGYVPQAQLGFFPFTIREVVLMGRTARIGLFGTPSARDGEIADELLRLLNIDNLADRPYTDVSGGERQLALIARALAQEPQVLVMDEPTASLDFGNQVRVCRRSRPSPSEASRSSCRPTIPTRPLSAPSVWRSCTGVGSPMPARPRMSSRRRSCAPCTVSK